MGNLVLFGSRIASIRPAKLSDIARLATKSEMKSIWQESRMFRFISFQDIPSSKEIGAKLRKEFGKYNAGIDQHKQKWAYCLAKIEAIRPEALVEIDDFKDSWQINFLGFPSIEVVELSISAYEYLSDSSISQDTLARGLSTLVPNLFQVGEKLMESQLLKSPFLLQLGLEYRLPLDTKLNVMRFLETTKNEAALQVVRNILNAFLEDSLRIMPSVLYPQTVWLDRDTVTIEYLEKMAEVFELHAATAEEYVIISKVRAKLQGIKGFLS